MNSLSCSLHVFGVCIKLLFKLHEVIFFQVVDLFIFSVTTFPLCLFYVSLLQVVGLTASIGVGNSKTDEEALNYILRVCACLDCRILSTVERHKEDLKPYINKPEEGSLTY